MKVLVTGAHGQLGRELSKTAPAAWNIMALDHRALDIRNANAVQTVVYGLGPHLIINAAAYTAVDKAELEPGNAYAVNADGAGHVARAALVQGARLIHLSTDFVFDGMKSAPYLVGDIPHPLGVYGASKLEGERQVMELTQARALILRTAWIYSAHGRKEPQIGR